MNTIKMPKCCCCSVKVGLLIWIVLGILGNAFGLFQRNIGLYGIIANVLGLVICFFGFYAVYAEKRALVKGYGFCVAFLTLAATGLQLFAVFSPEVKAAVKEIYEGTLNTAQVAVDFEQAWSTMQMMFIVPIAVGFLINCLILAFVYSYYKYLVQVEEMIKDKPYA
jgi:hypothetical protein